MSLLRIQLSQLNRLTPSTGGRNLDTALLLHTTKPHGAIHPGVQLATTDSVTHCKSVKSIIYKPNLNCSRHFKKSLMLIALQFSLPDITFFLIMFFIYSYLLILVIE